MAADHQSAFLAGEWSPWAQGRSDLPFYKQALNVCVNHIVTDEGAVTRRSGLEFICPTRNGLPAKLLSWTPDVNNPYILEITGSSLRMISGTSPVFTSHRPTITASSISGGFLSLTVSSVTGLAIGDDTLLYAPTGVDY